MLKFIKNFTIVWAWIAAAVALVVGAGFIFYTLAALFVATHKSAIVFAAFAIMATCFTSIIAGDMTQNQIAKEKRDD